MNANVYDKSRVPDVPQKAKTPARTGSAEWLAIAALLVLTSFPSPPAPSD